MGVKPMAGYCYCYYYQGRPERGFFGLRQPPNILETTPALFNHISFRLQLS